MGPLQSVLQFIQDFLNSLSLGNMLTSFLSAGFEVDLNTFVSSGFYQTGADLFGLLAIGLCFGYFLVYFINGLLDGKGNREFLVHGFIRLVIAMFLIRSGGVILTLLIDSGNDILSTVTQSFTIQNSSSKDFLNSDLVGSVLSIVIFIVTLIPNVLIVMIASFAVSAVSFSRNLELCLYTIGFPLIVPNIVLEGFHGNTLKYLKRFLGLCIQGAVMCAIVVCCSLLFETPVIKNVFEGTPFFEILGGIGSIATFIIDAIISLIHDAAVTFMLISMLFRSRQIAMDIVGAK